MTGRRIRASEKATINKSCSEVAKALCCFSEGRW